MSATRIIWLDPGAPPDAFPDVESALAEPDGLLAAGGDLGVERLIAAYRCGIFPWFEEGQPILWWSPDPRCILRPTDLHVSRRLRRYIRRSSAVLTFNRTFAEVIESCAATRRSRQGTWITRQMIDAYVRLHDNGWAHSIEVRENDRLIGGLYGVAIGHAFFAESMFSDAPSASSFALLGLSRHLLANNVNLIDCQIQSQHLLTLGATTVPRVEFLRILRKACDPPLRLGNWPKHPISVSDLLIQR
jgi:leucyl/phenylalanyl-tRNA--protein transferase